MSEQQKVLNSLSFWPERIMAENNPAPPASSGTQAGFTESNVFGAFGAVLGYLGAESATALVFERLLWPQRFYSNFGLSSVSGIALLTPMGGPLHKPGLAVLDQIYAHGLLKGPFQGHMLGTAFFPERKGAYTMQGPDGHTEPVRNFIWARAVTRIAFPRVRSPKNQEPLGQVEKGSQAPLRARVTVNHISIAAATPIDKESIRPFISEDTNTPRARIFVAILVSEITAILVAVGVFVAWRSAFAVVWIVPVVVRLLSTTTAQRREPLLSNVSSSVADVPETDFVIQCLQSDGNFTLVTGPSALVLQFFRHYGHPKRNRPRETAQLLCIVFFMSYFPIVLLVSSVWMPVNVQYVWLAYQIYVVIAMHIGRYTGWGDAATTEANITRAFSRQLCGRCTVGSEHECSILFGHTRQGPETLRVDLNITYHNRFRDGQAGLQQLLERQPRVNT